jgi:hypothetical protein
MIFGYIVNAGYKHVKNIGNNCGLSSLNTSLGCIQFSSMIQLLVQVAIANKTNQKKVFQEFIDTNGLTWHFRGPLVCKFVVDRFVWYSLKLVHSISS